MNCSNGAFDKFDRIACSSQGIVLGKLSGAKQLAKQAEKSLDEVEDVIDELEDLERKKMKMKTKTKMIIEVAVKNATSTIS